MLTKRVRDAVVVCGLSGMIGTTLVALTRAQQPEVRADSPQSKLRERLIALRTEVELLQIEHDADREDLVKSMSDLRTLRRDGLDREALDYIKSTVSMVSSAETFKTGGLPPAIDPVALNPPDTLKTAKEPAPFSGLYDDLMKSEEGRAELKDAGVTREEFLKIGQKPEELGKLLVRVTTKGNERKLQAEIQEKKAAFTHQTLELNRKKLDLGDAEARYKIAH